MNMTEAEGAKAAAGDPDAKIRRRVVRRIARELWLLDTKDQSQEQRKAGWETQEGERVKLARQLVRNLEKRGFTIVPPPGSTGEGADED